MALGSVPSVLKNSYLLIVQVGPAWKKAWSILLIKDWMHVTCTCLSVEREYTVAFPQWEYLFTHIPICLLCPLWEPSPRSPSMLINHLGQLISTSSISQVVCTDLGLLNSYFGCLTLLLHGISYFPLVTLLSAFLPLAHSFQSYLTASSSPGCPQSKASRALSAVQLLEVKWPDSILWSMFFFPTFK